MTAGTAESSMVHLGQYLTEHTHTTATCNLFVLYNKGTTNCEQHHLYVCPPIDHKYSCKNTQNARII